MQTSSVLSIYLLLLERKERLGAVEDAQFFHFLQYGCSSSPRDGLRMNLDVDFERVLMTNHN